MPGPGANPLVDFVNTKYNGGDQAKLAPTQELLYNDPKEYDRSIQEMYNHYKGQGSYTGVSFGDFRTAYVGKYGGPAVVKKKEDAAQSQNPNSPAATNGGLSGGALQPGTSSAQPNDAQSLFEQYKSSPITTTFAPNLNQTPGDIDLNANLSEGEINSAASQAEENPFQPTASQTDNPNIVNNPINIATQGGAVPDKGQITIGDADVKAQQETDAIIKNKTVQMNGYQSTMYYLNDFGGRVNKRLLDTPASILDLNARTYYDFAQDTGIGSDIKYEDYFFAEWSKMYRETIDKYLGNVAFDETESGGKKELDNTLQAQIAPAVADLAMVFAGGGPAVMGTKVLSQTALRNPNVVIGAFKELGTYIATPGSIISSTQVFNSEYEQAYTTLRNNGADVVTARNEAWNAGMRNAIISAPLEAIPAGKFFDRLDDLSGGGFKTRMTSMMVNGAKGFSEEAATEVAQQFFSNVDASLAYDETRQWTDGLIEAGMIGGLLGGTLSGIASGLTHRRDTATDPKEKAEYQKAIDHVVEKQSEVETLQAENQTLKNAARIQNIDNGITGILEKKDTISNDEISELEMLELQKEDIDKPMMDDLTRKTSGIDAKIKDLMLERELIYSKAMTGVEIQRAAEREKAIGSDLIKAINEKYQVRKKILKKQYIKEAQDKIANLNIQEDATRRRDEASSDTGEHIGTDQELQEEGSDSDVTPEIQGGSNQAGDSNIIQESGQVQEEIAPIETTETAKLPETGAGERVRKTALTVQESDFIADKTKDKVLSNAVYPVKSLDVTEKEANDLLAEHIEKGDDAVLNYVLRTPSDLKPDVKVGIAAAGLKYFAEKTKQAEKAGDQALVEKYADTQYEIIEKAVSEQATDSGRASNAIKLIKNASPEVQVISTKRAIEKTRNDYKKKNTDKFSTTASELNESNKDTAKATRKDRRIQKKLDEIKEGNSSKVSPLKKHSHRKEKIEKAKKEAKEELDKLFKELGKRSSSGVDPVLAGKIVAQGAKYGYYLAVDGYYDFKEWSAKMKADIGPEAEEYLDDIWKASHEGEKISEVAKLVKENEVRFNTEKAIKDNLDDKFDKIVTQHYTEVDKKKSDLVNKLVDDLDLSENDAKELATLVEDTFDKLSREKKLAILKKKTDFKDKVYPKRIKQVYEKVIELSNVGSIDENQLADIYADEFSTKELTPEQTKQLRKLAEKVQTAPEGFQKQNAVQDLYKYQDSLDGLNFTDVLTSVWYANVLSGYTTHAQNSFANLVETIANLSVIAAKNPKNAVDAFNGLRKGFIEGAIEAYSIMKTGYSPVKSVKVDTLNALERLNKKNPISYLKYVSRIMSAADAIAYGGNKEMRAAEMAASVARRQKKEFPDKSTWKEVSEILNNTEEKKKAAEVQAKEEGLTGLDFKRRVTEILEQSRAQDIIEDSSDFAARATFNGPSDGALGALTDLMTKGVEMFAYKGIKPLKYIVPFTRIISNVANKSLDWTPYGYKRAISGTGLLLSKDSKYRRELSQDEKWKATIKATAGVLGMIAAYAMSDPEDGIIEITADGTGDTKKNYELAEKGWQKYSVKIGDTWYSYANTPFNVPFSIIGNLRDNEKYKGESLDDKAVAERFAIATLKGFKVITDMTFLKAIGEFTGIFGSDSPVQSMKYLENVMISSAKGYVLPNFVSQASKDIMRTNNTPMKQVGHLWEGLYRDIPGLNSGDIGLPMMYPMINAIGDPIVPDTDKFTSTLDEEDPKTTAVWNVIIDNKAWVGKVSKAQLQSSLNDVGWDGEVTDQQYYEYSKVRGGLVKKKIIAHLDALNKMKPEEVKNTIDKYKREATKGAKYQVFKLN